MTDRDRIFLRMDHAADLCKKAEGVLRDASSAAPEDIDHRMPALYKAIQDLQVRTNNLLWDAYLLCQARRLQKKLDS